MKSFCFCVFLILSFLFLTQCSCSGDTSVSDTSDETTPDTSEEITPDEAQGESIGGDEGERSDGDTTSDGETSDGETSDGETSDGETTGDSGTTGSEDTTAGSGTSGDGGTTTEPLSVTIDSPSDGAEVVVGGSLTFSSTASGGTGTITYAWDFDADGTTDSSEEDPGEASPTEYGDDTITLTVTDEAGNTALASVSVSVIGIAAIDAGGYHTCATMTDGSASCWGQNFYGELGDGTTTASSSAVAVDMSAFGGATIQKTVSSNKSAWTSRNGFTCALLSTGAVYCWGYNGYGQLGNGSYTNTTTPTAVSGIDATTPATDIDAGKWHTCAIMATGTVSCWGSGDKGELGNGGTSYSATPVTVSGITALNPATAIALGAEFSCALLQNGRVKCWGNGDNGQLGNGGTSDSSTPVNVSGISATSPAQAIAVGAYHACTLMAGGGIKCWGRGDSYQLGNGSTSDASTAVLVSTISSSNPAKLITAGQYHSCAALEDNAISCWGYNGNGEIGDGTTTNASSPTDVAGFDSSDTVSSLSAGFTYTCATLSTGAAKCWGENIFGQLGNGSVTATSTPTLVSEIKPTNKATGIALGEVHSCATLTNGSVKCWGRNPDGRLGNGTNEDTSTPVSVSGISSATKVASGYYHSCALLSSGTVSCWGSGNYGSLGDGSMSASSTPTTVSTIDASTSSLTATAVCAGEEFSCALMQDGGAMCWGRGTEGQLGNGTSTTSSTPLSVSGIDSATPAAAIDCGYRHACARMQDGTVKCWGQGDDGELGNGLSADSATPVTVSGITTTNPATVVSAGHQATCAVLTDGTAFCWGTYTNGKLGNGSTSSQATPTAVSDIDTTSPASAIDMSGNTTCAVMGDSSLKCWGENYYGQTGQALSSVSVETPEDISDIDGSTNAAASVSVGAAGHTCSLLSNGTVMCWGYNAYGGVGSSLGVIEDTLTPVSVEF